MRISMLLITTHMVCIMGKEARGLYNEIASSVRQSVRELLFRNTTCMQTAFKILVICYYKHLVRNTKQWSVLLTILLAKTWIVPKFMQSAVTRFDRDIPL